MSHINFGDTGLIVQYIQNFLKDNYNKNIHLSDEYDKETHFLKEKVYHVYTEEELENKLDYLMKDNSENGIWKSEIFGRSLDSIVKEGIQAKLSLLPENARFKLQQTLTKLVNKGSGNLFAIVI